MVQKARNLYKVPPYTKIHTLQTNYIQDNYNKINNYHKKVRNLHLKRALFTIDKILKVHGSTKTQNLQKKE